MPIFESRDDIPEYGREGHTPGDLLAHYIKEQRPVRFEALREIIEPLCAFQELDLHITSTSFGRMALDALHTTFDKQKLVPPPHAVMPRDLYLAFFKHIDDTNIDNDLKGTDAMSAETALWSFLTHNVAVHSIYPDARLEPGEMAFHQKRDDDVWHDPEHTVPAFTHGIAQWQFFRNGQRVGEGISVQSAYWTDSSILGSHMFHILAEGSPEGRRFFDERLTGIEVLPKSLQGFKRYTNLLFVSDRFDFDQALRAVKTGRPRGRS